MQKRCNWVPENDELYIKYHDEEWGVPVRNDKQLFAKLMLDAFQAGLSWRTILYKRENFLSAFDGFDPEKVSRYSESKIQALMQNEGIIRNQAKIRATVNNSKLLIEQFPEEGDFTKFLWSFVGGETINHKIKTPKDYLATSSESDEMSKQLKKLGWKFMGSTVCYAFMQAVGMFNDHQLDCFKHDIIAELK